MDEPKQQTVCGKCYRAGECYYDSRYGRGKICQPCHDEETIAAADQTGRLLGRVRVARYHAWGLDGERHSAESFGRRIIVGVN